VAIPLLLFGLGMEKDPAVQKINNFTNIAIPAVIIFLGIREQRAGEGNGYLTFGKGFSTGMMIALIGGVISTVFTYLYFTILNPGIVTYIKLKQEEEMLKRGMSESQVESMAENMDTWTSPGMMTAFVFLGILLLGLVISLISSAILKKENPAEQIS
jgi:hypothetical protein